MKRILTSLTLSAVLASPAWPLNKQFWDSMRPDQQAIYLVGALDLMLTGEPDQPPSRLRNGMLKCYLQERFTAELMRNLVLQSYERNGIMGPNSEKLGVGIHLWSALELYCESKGVSFD